jgi:amino acid adenylation domain-containing protein
MPVNTASMPTTASRKEEALWILDRLVPSSGVNNLTMAIQSDGPLGEWELRESLAHLLRRHAVLRTVFQATPAGLFKQVMDHTVFPSDLHKFHPEPDRLEEDLAEFVAEPFTFDGSPLLRAAHFECDSGDVFLLVVHHLVFDTLSSDILMREFAVVYDAVAEGLEPPPEVSGPAPLVTETAPAQESLAYWREHLNGFDPTALDLWCGSADLAEPTLTGRNISHALSADARAAIKRLQEELRAPEAVVLLAAYAVLLARHGAGPDIVVGSPASVRPREVPDAVGYHINTLPLRLRVDLNAGFRALVAQAREVFFGALTHADVPVDMILSDVRTDSTTSWRNPVFKHMFNYVPDTGGATFEMADVRARRLVVENGFSKFDLEFFFISSADAIDLRAVYYTEILSRSDVEYMIERFESLLATLGADPDLLVGAVPPFGAQDREVIGAANDTARPLRGETVLDRIAASVRERPDAIAVENGAAGTTYAELWRTAVATRDALVDAGVTAGSVVALLSRRGVNLVASVLGVWLAGAAYLPLDPEHPAQRLTFQLDDSETTVVIADPDVDVPAADHRTVLNPLPVAAGGAAHEVAATPARGDALAYLIYTSGSTGRPKGTGIGHRNLINLIEHFEDELRALPGEGTLWMTTFSFDISALELFLPLVSGGRVVVCPDQARTNGKLLLEVLRDRQVDIVQATPTTWRVIVDEAENGLAGRRVLCGGEPMPATLARRLSATGCELRNVYGPTETTIWSTSGRLTVTGDDRVHVGVPIANTQIYIADPDGRDLPVGVSGELCIAGEGVAIGYHRRPDLTAERFVEHIEYGRSYRTGDLARWLPDGTLEVLGRLDRQVKVRGNRIELGEVEAVLGEHTAVAAVAVVVRGNPDTDGALVAFVVARGKDEKLKDELWRHAMDTLPRSAVPQEFLFVDEFPTTGNDKINYPALARQAAEQHAALATGTSQADTGDELLDSLIGLWSEFLGRGDITPQANFFAHGGQSLLGAQLVQRVEETMNVQLKLADLFSNPTPEMFARRVKLAGESRTTG